MMIRVDETMHYEFDDEMDCLESMNFEQYVATLSYDELDEMLAFGNLSREEWRICYNAYCEKYEEMNRKYYEENIDDFRKFESELRRKCEKGIATAEDLNFYSDWHKDMFGHRPRYEWMRCK